MGFCFFRKSIAYCQAPFPSLVVYIFPGDSAIFMFPLKEANCFSIWGNRDCGFVLAWLRYLPTSSGETGLPGSSVPVGGEIVEGVWAGTVDAGLVSTLDVALTFEVSVEPLGGSGFEGAGWGFAGAGCWLAVGCWLAATTFGGSLALYVQPILNWYYKFHKHAFSIHHPLYYRLIWSGRKSSNLNFLSPNMNRRLSDSSVWLLTKFTIYYMIRLRLGTSSSTSFCSARHFSSSYFWISLKIEAGSALLTSPVNIWRISYRTEVVSVQSMAISLLRRRLLWSTWVDCPLVPKAILERAQQTSSLVFLFPFPNISCSSLTTSSFMSSSTNSSLLYRRFPIILKLGRLSSWLELLRWLTKWKRI